MQTPVQLSKDTWQVEWTETVKNRTSGKLIGTQSYQLTANVLIAAPKDEAQLRPTWLVSTSAIFWPVRQLMMTGEYMKRLKDGGPFQLPQLLPPRSRKTFRRSLLAKVKFCRRSIWCRPIRCGSMVGEVTIRLANQWKSHPDRPRRGADGSVKYLLCHPADVGLHTLAGLQYRAATGRSCERRSRGRQRTLENHPGHDAAGRTLRP